MTKSLAKPPKGFFLNGERQGRGMRLTLGAVVSVSELSDERIMLVSHGGRIMIAGTRLSLTVFEERSVEVFGGVTEVRFFYGRN